MANDDRERYDQIYRWGFEASKAERRVAELEEQLARCLATDHARFYHLWKSRAEAAGRRVAELEAAAHMPDDYEYGLESWINQHLYAAYIGARFSDVVMEQIRNGRLTFPEAPVYAEYDALRQRVAELETRLADQEWRPVTDEPGQPGHFLVYDDDGERFLFAGIWPYRVARWDDGWGSSLTGLVDYWRPLPPPPTATK